MTTIDTTRLKARPKNPNVLQAKTEHPGPVIEQGVSREELDAMRERLSKISGAYTALILARQTREAEERMLVESTIVEACSLCRVSAHDVARAGYTKRSARARELIAVILRDHSSLSYPDIAEAIGKPRTSHSSVMEAHARIRNRMSDLDHADLEHIRRRIGVKQPAMAAKQEAGLA